VTPRREQLPWIFGILAAVVATGALGAAFAPALLVHAPLLLIGLSPLGRHLVMAATVTEMLPFVLVAASRRLLVGVLAYYLGHINGDEGLAWLEGRSRRLGRLARFFERIFRRAGVVALFVVPGPPFCALAGVVRMPMRIMLPVAAVGQIMWCSITYLLGDALSQWIAPIMAFITRHMVETTAVCVLLVGGYELYRRLSRRKSALDDLAASAPLPERPGE